ncbi:hypothetical protein DFH09DRAFT_1101497 [Mycena vulgaris]|nr:hypothetical protein DFH09DRAFT_1101497 [Mycena vulgaris]
MLSISAYDYRYWIHSASAGKQYCNRVGRSRSVVAQRYECISGGNSSATGAQLRPEGSAANAEGFGAQRHFSKSRECSRREFRRQRPFPKARGGGAHGFGNTAVKGGRAGLESWWDCDARQLEWHRWGQNGVLLWGICGLRFAAFHDRVERDGPAYRVCGVSKSAQTGVQESSVGKRSDDAITIESEQNGIGLFQYAAYAFRLDMLEPPGTNPSLGGWLNHALWGNTELWVIPAKSWAKLVEKAWVKADYGL